MKATFEFYYHGKFRLGYWVSEHGEPNKTLFLGEVFQHLRSEGFNTLEMLLMLKRVSLLNELRKPALDPKNPFYGQLSSEREPLPPQDLFWFKKLSEKKTIHEGIYTSTKYQFKFNENNFIFNLEYNGQKNSWIRSYKKLNYKELLEDVVEWTYQLDRELADCDCLN